MGLSPLVLLNTSVSRVTMFLMWMVVLLSSSTSSSRFKFGSLYTIRRALFWIYFVLFCFTTEHPGNAAIVVMRQDNGVI